MQKDFEVPVPVNSSLKKEGACPIPPPSPACCEAASTLMSFSQLTSSSNTEHPLCYCQSEEFGPKVLQNPNEQVPLIAGDESNVVCLVRLIEPPSGSTPKRPPCLLEPQPLSPSIAG